MKVICWDKWEGDKNWFMVEESPTSYYRIIREAETLHVCHTTKVIYSLDDKTHRHPYCQNSECIGFKRYNSPEQAVIVLNDARQNPERFIERVKRADFPHFLNLAVQ